MINTKEWSKNYGGWVAIERFGFDVGRANRAIMYYEPQVANVEFTYTNVSLFVVDKNNGIPPMWMDYYIDRYGDLTGEWNQFVFNHWNEDDMFRMVFQDDPEVFELADEEAFHYLLSNGYMKDLSRHHEGRGYAWTDKAYRGMESNFPKTIDSPNAKASTHFSLNRKTVPKPSAKTVAKPKAAPKKDVPKPKAVKKATPKKPLAKKTPAKSKGAKR